MTTKTTKRTWSSLGATLSGQPAEGGSRSVYYRCKETGELCYRRAGWQNMRFADYGPGIGITETGPGDWEANGSAYPASEF